MGSLDFGTEAVQIGFMATNPATYGAKNGRNREVPVSPFTPKEVLTILGLRTTRSLRYLEKKGLLRPVRVNPRVLRYDVQEVMALIQRR